MKKVAAEKYRDLDFSRARRGAVVKPEPGKTKISIRRLDRQPDGELRFRRPDGRLLPEVPLPPEVRGDPVKILQARNDADGLHLHARTATPGWLGERLDVGWAIDVLHPLAC